MDKSPRPKKQSYLQALYDTIDSLGGATLPQIKQYLPATSAMENVVTIDNKRVVTALGNGVYRGYFVIDGKPSEQGTYWHISPLTYFNERWLAVSVKEKQSRKRRKNRAKYAAKHHPKAKAKAKPQPKANGVLGALDADIHALSAQERIIHNKIDRLRKVRVRLVNIVGVED